MRRIHKQADGLYAVWTTVVDDYIAIDCSKKEALEIYIEMSVEHLKEAAQRDLELARPADEQMIEVCRKEMA